MFSGLIKKIQSIMFPIFFILLTFVVLIYFSFFHIMRDDFIKKSQQFSHQVSKNFSLQLENIQKTTDIMIRKYNLDSIDLENSSKIALVKSLSLFRLYNPNISQVHLLHNDTDFLHTDTELYTSLTDDFDYTAHQNSWFYSKTHNAMVYTQALSENSTYIAVLFNIDVSHLLPRKHSPFSDFEEICAVTNDEKLYRILKSDGSSALSDAEVLDISRLPKYADGVYKDNSIYSVTDIRQQSLKIVSVQSADYIARQFRQITLFLAIFLAFLMLLCFFAINKVSRWVSYSLETLNEKLRTGALQIDELSSDLK